MTIVVNLFAGPGTGKSTTAAALFAELKYEGITTELASEYAKDKVWENSLDVLSNQIYIFGKQHHRIHRLLNKVEVVITDCPLILTLWYGRHHGEKLGELVLNEHNKLNNFNVFLQRAKLYNPAGRLQTESEARDIDGQLRKILTDNNIQIHHDEVANREVVYHIKYKVMKQLGVNYEF